MTWYRMATAAWAVAGLSLLCLASVDAAPAGRTGTIVYLVDGDAKRRADLCRSLRTLDDHYNDRFHAPVTVFYAEVRVDLASGHRHVSGAPVPEVDDYGEGTLELPGELTEAHRAELAACTRSTLTFAAVDFESMVAPDLLAAVPAMVGPFPVGYRHMCNFFAGPIALHAALSQYRYYWRLDTDTEIIDDVQTDVFDVMVRASARYGHGNVQCDTPEYTDGLYDIAREVFGPTLPQRLAHGGFADAGVCRWSGPPYNNRMYYNNFEVVDLDFMRSPAYTAFYKAVAAANGIFTKRWGDAPIRTLAVQALLPPAAIHAFTDVSYWHQGYYGPCVARWITSGVLAGVAAIGIAMYLARGMLTSMLRGRIYMPLRVWETVCAAAAPVVAVCDALSCGTLALAPHACAHEQQHSSTRSSDAQQGLASIYKCHALCTARVPLYNWCAGLPPSLPNPQVSRPAHTASPSSAVLRLDDAGGGAAAGERTSPRSSSSSAEHIVDMGGGTPTSFARGRTGAAVTERKKDGTRRTVEPPPHLLVGTSSAACADEHEGDTLSANSSDLRGANSFPTNTTDKGPDMGHVDTLATHVPDGSSIASVDAVKVSVMRSQLRAHALVLGIVALLALATSRTRLHSSIFPASSPVSDGRCAPDDLPCLLAAVADSSKRVVVTCATTGMSDFIHNLLYSLTATRTHNYLVFALDAEAATYFIAHNVPVYWDPAPLSSLAATSGNKAGSGASGLAGGLGVVSAATDNTGSAFRFGSSEYQAVTMRKNELMLEVLTLGYHAFFTDADTVWLRNPLDEDTHGPEPTEGFGPSAPRLNPYLGHRCGELRLGDTTSSLGETLPQLLLRDDCPGGVAGQYRYDVKGMYGDVGGMDTGYWYIRSTQHSLDHMAAVVAFQRTPEGLKLPSDQETFNAMLEPWRADRVQPGEHIDSQAGFGPSHMRVAMFDPLQAPNGCRLPHAEAAGVPLLLVHANCRTGWWQKVPWMIQHGVWYVRLWTDERVEVLVIIAALLLALRHLAQLAIIALGIDERLYNHSSRGSYIALKARPSRSDASD